MEGLPIKDQAHFTSGYPIFYLQKTNRFTVHHRSASSDVLAARRTFHMIHMIGMNVPEHRGATQLGLAAPEGPHDDPDPARRQPDYGILGI